MDSKTGKRTKIDGLPGRDLSSDIVLSGNHVYIARSYDRVGRPYVARLPG